MSKIDLPFDTIIADGTKITSRYHDRHELFCMMCALANVPQGLRGHILSIWRDSKGGGYAVGLDHRHSDTAQIGKLLSDGFMTSGGHETISIFRDDMQVLEIEQRYPAEVTG